MDSNPKSNPNERLICMFFFSHVNPFTGITYQSVLLTHQPPVRSVSMEEAILPNTSPAQWPGKARSDLWPLSSSSDSRLTCVSVQVWASWCGCWARLETRTSPVCLCFFVRSWPLSSSACSSTVWPLTPATSSSASSLTRSTASCGWPCSAAALALLCWRNPAHPQVLLSSCCCLSASLTSTGKDSWENVKK